MGISTADLELLAISCLFLTALLSGLLFFQLQGPACTWYPCPALAMHISFLNGLTAASIMVYIFHLRGGMHRLPCCICISCNVQCIMCNVWEISISTSIHTESIPHFF